MDLYQHQRKANGTRPMVPLMRYYTDRAVKRIKRRLVLDGYVFRPRKWYEPSEKEIILGCSIFVGLLVGWFVVFPALRFILTVL